MTVAEAPMTTSARTIAALAAVGLMAGAVALGPIATAVAWCLLGIAIALGWPFLLELPNPGTARRVMIVAAIVSAPVCYFGTIRTLAFAAGGVVVAGFIEEMLRRDGRPRLLEQISGTVSGGLLVLVGAVWTRVVMLSADGAEISWVVCAGLAAAIACEFPVPRHHRHLRPAAAMIGACVGTVLIAPAIFLGWPRMILAALGTGIIVALLDSVLRRLPPATHRRPAIATAVVPAGGAGILAFILSYLAA
ncbi:MAG: hypothetical protein Q4P33_08255 [Flaviflexus sp.]|nr:hypothetical protein [Flaviflexus sp.]